MAKVSRIPLDKRIERLKVGSPSDPDFTVKIIKTMADMPIADYLNTFDREKQILMEMFHLSEKRLKELTYQDIAFRIRNKWLLPEGKEDAVVAMDLLGAPMRFSYEERQKREEE